MSGIVGHTLYALLGLKEANKRGLPLAAIAERNLPNFLAGAYIGSDIQVMPEAICLDTGREVGFGTVPLKKSPLTGGPVRLFQLDTPTGLLSPYQVFDRFYGRAHLVFGFKGDSQELRVPWDHLPEYFAAVLDDAVALFDSAESSTAYALGWIVHVVSDSLIKGIQPGIDLDLIDGRYTLRNRPVQDLYSFHEVGIKELRLDWPALFRDMAGTPVEPLQLHYMRCAKEQGKLGDLFSHGWTPDQETTVRAVLAENRRWLKSHAATVLADMELHGGECNDRICEIVGLDYAGMIDAAKKANLRETLLRIGREVADMFEAVSALLEPLKC